MNKVFRRVNGLARALIVPVLIWNLQCAFAFLSNPSGFAPSFELEGIIGQSVIRSLAILFLMWNIPYLFALADPTKFFISLIQALIMQSVGVIGETWLLTTIPAEHTLLRVSITRFVVFDGLGVVLLASAVIWVIYSRQKVGKYQENLTPDQ